MAAFLEDLWNSVFTPGPTPTLLVATNATFGALQFLLLALLAATRSVHFIVLSFLCAGLWYSINWFARELQAEQKTSTTEPDGKRRKERSPEPGSDTETEAAPEPAKMSSSALESQEESSVHLRPRPVVADDGKRRRSLGDSSGYVSTDSEWEKVSEGDKEI